MTDFIIHLVSLGQSFSLDREKFSNLFPDSVLTPLLIENDSINLEHSDVVPEAIIILREFTNGCSDVTSVTDPEAVRKAGHYLGIDLLTVIGDPHYPEFVDAFTSLFLVKPQHLRMKQHRLLVFAIKQHYDVLLRYLLDRFPADEAKPRDNEILLLQAILYGYNFGVTSLLPRVDPMKLRGNIADIWDELKYDDYGGVPYSIGDYYSTLKVMPYGQLIYLAGIYHPELIPTLLNDPRVSDPEGAIITAFSRNQNVLLSMTRLIEKFDYQPIIIEPLLGPLVRMAQLQYQPEQAAQAKTLLELIDRKYSRDQE